jgi:cob(I)alamin adenosyltransferase
LQRCDITEAVAIRHFSSFILPSAFCRFMSVATMQRIDELLAHVWMVRAFLKHSDEAQEDEELQEIHRELYDYMLALGQAWKDQDADAYLRMAHKKFRKLRDAAAKFAEIQQDVSAHTNFQMAARSLTTAVCEIGKLIEDS